MGNDIKCESNHIITWLQCLLSMWHRSPKIRVMQGVNTVVLATLWLNCGLSSGRSEISDTKWRLFTKLKYTNHRKVMCCLCCALLLRNWSSEDQLEFVCWFDDTPEGMIFMSGPWSPLLSIVQSQIISFKMDSMITKPVIPLHQLVKI